MKDPIERQDAIDAVEFGITYAKVFDVNTGESKELFKEGNDALKEAVERLKELPSAQPEIIRCKDCEYGEQDEVGRWFCRSLGCQIGNEDGSGYCADAERRADDSISD